MRTETKKARGRPRAYDPVRALGAALEAFRVHGYSGTSLDQLSEVTRMSRPSLYAAFGNKKTIYRLALAQYHKEVRRRLGAELFAGRGLREDLLAFFEAACAEYESPVHGKVGCSVICTATTEALQDEDIRQDLSMMLNRIDAGLNRRFRQAKREEFPDLNPKACALVTAAALHSLAIRVRAAQSGFEVSAFPQAAVDLVVNAAQ
ncbi:MAG: TetR/AcrR family transcriptional regulator [Verrucomicrobiota bacterium]